MLNCLFHHQGWEIPKLRSVLIVSLLFLLSACEDGGLSPGEGYVEVEGGRVWYQIVGSGRETPLLLLHGGPGAPSFYLGPLRRLAVDRPVIFYDQLGAGRSDRPSDTSLWRIDRFVNELATVREALDLEDVHILGNSWGSMLAVDYILTKPEGVHSLILASPALSVRRWTADADRLIAKLPESAQKAIRRSEKAKTYDDPEYQAATDEYYRRHLTRTDPMPEEMRLTMENFGTEVYMYMWGPTEFTATGTLRNYEREDVLPEIDLPVLFTVGRHDEATPETVLHFQSLVPGSKIEILENSAHMTMLDEPEEYANVVRMFLDDVDNVREEQAR